MKKYSESTRFGIYNKINKTWRQDIMAKTKVAAHNMLADKIGDGARCCRYEERALPAHANGVPYIPSNRYKKEKNI